MQKIGSFLKKLHFGQKKATYACFDGNPSIRHVKLHEQCYFASVGSPLPCPHLRGRGDRNLQDLFGVLECTGVRFVP